MQFRRQWHLLLQNQLDICYRMTKYIEGLIKSWADDEMNHINLKINHLEGRLFKTYEPNKFVNGEFWDRCDAWLSSATSDEHKKTLYRLLTQIFYVGPIEFEELFRCAYDGPIARWLIDREQIDICAENAQQRLIEAVEKTWFCPITDSFRINSFFHINNLPANANLRPDWCSLRSLGDIYKVKNYCKNQNVKRLVLLEDFVGGGSQSLAAVKFAATHIEGLEVLFVPMIICPDGAVKARLLEDEVNLRRNYSLRFDPVLELNKPAFFTETDSSLPERDTEALRDLIKSSYDLVSGGVKRGEPYHMYGFPPKRPTGGLVVMYTNTPNNTLPLIHWRPKSESWQPVFPRHSRV
ncbi:hypothetical protein [Delftia acidovorans]|jgi:hypothetical protein|uniref:phosphoribosyltransferase-like protein n=1 Tax=Delftia acidovorans TaxID=80866 RepID=UPI0022AB5294|nr:hypothetical protein [Delftia acidovorans]WAT84022.1 hypothetical protein O1V13_21645 [Delftia acidovorans]